MQRRDEDRQLRAWVLAALRARREARTAAIDRLGAPPPALVAFALRNRVAPTVAHAVIERDPAAATGEWGAIHHASVLRMKILLDETDAVATRCAQEGIKVVALKNAGIARGVYPCAGCCPMGDVDLLVEHARFREAHALILECGFQLASRSVVEPADLELGFASGGTEYLKRVGGEEVWFELQWRPVAGRWIRKDQEPDGAELVARSVPIAGTDVRLLAPTDNMLQVALHTAKHTYVRAPGLRLHTDVDRLATLAPPDWNALTAAAAKLEVKTPVYFALDCARTLLDSPIPEAALTALAPGAWKRAIVLRWLDHVDFFEPDLPKFSRPAMMVFAALQYDDLGGFAASAMDTDREHLALRYLPRNLARGARRIWDVATRYQK